MTSLPTPLASWEEALAPLDARLATALGPAVRLLDDLIGRLDAQRDGDGEPDGYDGTTNRGDLSRLLLDEWALAYEVPDEFLRRAAEGELAFLRVARQRDAPTGLVVAIVDTGPEQLGVGRLVQLAALVVLHRRAQRAGSDLLVRLLPSGAVVGAAGLADLLTRWLAARSTTQPSADAVAAAFADVDRDDRVWLLGGPTVRSHAPPEHRRTVSSWVTRWGDGGLEEVAVRVGDATARLAVPEKRVAVAALRGEGLMRRRTTPAVAAVATTGHGAVFNSADTRLLWRGDSGDELLGCFVRPGGTPAVRSFRLPGTVLAAASLGRRLVAAVTDGTTLWVEVVGKRLARTDRIHVALTDVGLDPAGVERALGGPPATLFLRGSEILLRTPAGWWILHEDAARPIDPLAVAPGAALDHPREVYAEGVRAASAPWREAAFAAGPVLGPPEHGDSQPRVAWSEDSRVWKVAAGTRLRDSIAVGEGERVVGLASVGYEATLVVVSPSTRIVRLVSAHGVRTLTAMAGPAHFSLHPLRPWLARTTPERITVADLHTGSVLVELGVAP